jgi:hypothetical protein
MTALRQSVRDFRVLRENSKTRLDAGVADVELALELRAVPIKTLKPAKSLRV